MTYLNRDPETKDVTRSATSPCAVIVSDVLLYRDGVAAGVAQLGDIHIIGVCGGKDAAATIARLTPDLVILDMSRPVAFQLPRLIAIDSPGTPIIGFGVGNHDEAIACAEAGIVAFVGADGTVADLNRTALLALEGKVECSPILAAKLFQRLATLADGAAAHPTSLTRREQEIAYLVDDGLSNKEIAGSLNISPATVKNHVHTILEKLNIHKRNAIGRLLDSARHHA